MERYDYLIIGGGVAGVTAAETIRELDSASSIAVVSDEAHALYSRVMLPHYVKGVFKREKVFLRNPSDYAARGITFLGSVAVSGLDVHSRRVTLDTGSIIEFGKLLIAGGGRPRSLPAIPASWEGVSRFQTIEDADAMLRLLPSRKQAVVVGSSFIALEYLGILSHFGIPATLIFREPHFFGGHLDPDGGELLHEQFRRHGVRAIIPGDTLAAVEGDSAVSGVMTAAGTAISCDFLGLGVGLERNTSWLRGSGLTVTDFGVRTNEFLQTNAAGVFAAGDIAEFYDPRSRMHHSRGNWTNSFLQGKTAGWNMARPDARQAFQYVSSYTIKSLGMVISFVGDTRVRAGVDAVTRLGRDRSSHARFFLAREQLIGAVLINRPHDAPAVTVRIQTGESIRDLQAKLSDESFDLAEVLR